jgi:hypothetical protein
MRLQTRPEDEAVDSDLPGIREIYRAYHAAIQGAVQTSYIKASDR